MQSRVSEYVIAAGVWHHAKRVSFLRIDSIQLFVLIPYRRQAADFIHGFAVILRVAFLYYELKKDGYDCSRLSFCFSIAQRQPLNSQRSASRN